MKYTDRYPRIQSSHTPEIERGLKSLETWRTCRVAEILDKLESLGPSFQNSEMNS